MPCSQVYVTVFEKHESLVGMLRKFGFQLAGAKANGESVYVKDKHRLDFRDPYLCFPFIHSAFESANLLVINDTWHDVLFPYSELANETQLQETLGRMRRTGSPRYTSAVLMP